MAGSLGCGPGCDCGSAKDGLLSEIIGSTRAWCQDCLTAEPAFYTSDAGGVFLERLCPRSGARRIKIAESKKWYSSRLSCGLTVNPPEQARPVLRGCPNDCGPCRAHLGRLRLPIFSITNQCQLACPICFTHNRKDRIYHKSPEELERLLDVIEAGSEYLDLINLTGGEPTLHPNLPDLLRRCAKRHFGMVSMNSNGLIIGDNQGLAETIKELGAQIILSLDTMRPEKSLIIHGADIVQSKLEALAMLERLDIPTAILMVWIPGINDDEIPALVAKYLFKGFVKGISIQTIAFTGYHGSRFQPRRRATLEEVENAFGRSGLFDKSDFFAHGSYHPLCYSVAYYLVDGGEKIPLTRLAEAPVLTRATQFGYLMSPTKELTDCLLEKINELWASKSSPVWLGILKKMIRLLNGSQAQASGDLSVDRALGKSINKSGLIKTLTIHAHMDHDNFDLARVATCGDLVPEESGELRPACAYNLIYRQRDPRFWTGPAGACRPMN
jgi:uncharacterized radical SAM superfamily Fe-S cluster-containing enzyme